MGASLRNEYRNENKCEESPFRAIIDELGAVGRESALIIFRDTTQLKYQDSIQATLQVSTIS